MGSQSSRQLAILLGMAIAASIQAQIAQAQITEDATLPTPSVIRSTGNRVVITGGSQAGSNLFHSFRSFSVPRGGIASFQQIQPNIRNIITRVTGSSASRINGTIEALQPNGSLSPANFFLLNPNGVVFGRNASLNLGGSFLATTGDRLTFLDGFQFNANGTQTSTLLTVSVPVGLQFGQTPGILRNAARGHAIDRDQDGQYDAGGLQVTPGHTLALVGSPLVFDGGIAIAPAGRIELGSVAGDSSIRINSNDTGWTLNYDGVRNWRGINFGEQLAAVSVNGETPDQAAGGSIQIQGGNVRLSGSAFITSYNRSALAGGNIQIRADRLSLEDYSGINTLTEADGKGGDIRVDARQLSIQSGSQIVTLTRGAGNGGNIIIPRADRIELSGQGSVDSTGNFLATGILAQAAPDAAASARAGNLTLRTQTLQLQQGAEISTTTFGAADGGHLNIRASNIVLDGTLINPQTNRPIVDANGRTFPTGLFADTDQNTSGNGGELRIQTDRLWVRNGAVVQTNAEDRGNAGNLTIRATDFIEVRGTAGERLNPSLLYAASGGIPNLPGVGNTQATGRGGTLRLFTPELRILQGGAIAVGSSNPNRSRGAGRLEVEAQRILLSDRARILSETASGNGGNLVLQAQDLLFLNRNSQISTSAGVERRTGGNGGNIQLAAGFVVAPPATDSDIRANASEGTGGNIQITTQSILGLAIRRAVPNNGTNDLDASSDFGVNGTILINQLQTDPSRGLSELPTVPIDASTQIAQACSTQTARRLSSFFVTGRSGLPPSPNSFRNREAIATDWVTLAPEDKQVKQGRLEQGQLEQEQSEQQPERSFVRTHATSQMPISITEAQGWMRDTHGEVILVASAPTATPQSPGWWGDRCVSAH